ncbi:MAG: hypothetical protein JXJ17_11920 [Anaerolineae bacterium]|nr:hypothetical protein [Anaerolineae bacterium]
MFSIPVHLYVQIEKLIAYAAPLRDLPQQEAARRELIQAVTADDPHAVVAALRSVNQSRRFDIAGREIPYSRCCVRRRAYRLALDLQRWLDDQAAEPMRMLEIV